MSYLENEYNDDFPEEGEVIFEEDLEEEEEEDEDTIRELEVNERGIPMGGEYSEDEDE